MKILFIADFFRDQLLGGGESNDDNLIQYLKSQGVDVKTINSQFTSPADLDGYSKVIVGNFVLLSPPVRQLLMREKKYIIYEHDHKYLATRDPSKFYQFHIPPEQVINREFYECAERVVVLSKICKDILQQAIPKASIHNIGCSLWSTETLDYIQTLSSAAKSSDYCILKSTNATKNYPKTKEFCASKGINPLEIQSSDYYEFLKLMSTSKSFIFLPTVLETFSRVCAEAKMLNLEVRTVKNLIGFYSEDFSSLQGDELNQRIRQQNKEAYQYFYDLVVK